jgi:hypothetical protein
MSWKLERDSLIAETLAFVESVTGKREKTGRPDAAFVHPPQPKVGELESAAQPSHVVFPKTTETRQRPPSTPPVPTPERPFTPGEMAAEIRARVASFRAHQERFNREREEYFATTLARLRAAIKDGRPPLPHD